MITVVVENTEQLRRQFGELRQDFDKAMAAGLNKTGETLIERERLEMQQKIKDQPVNFTLNSHRQFKATPSKLSTLVFVMDKQAAYLQSITAGKPYTGIAPAKPAKLTKYGNIQNKKEGLAGIKSSLSNQEQWIGRVEGVARRGRYKGQGFSIFGRWARQEGGLRMYSGSDEVTTRGVILVAKWVINDQREIRLRWYETAEDWVNLKLPDNIENEIDLAIALYGSRART